MYIAYRESKKENFWFMFNRFKGTPNAKDARYFRSKKEYMRIVDGINRAHQNTCEVVLVKSMKELLVLNANNPALR